jgi:2-polyprenyl-6-methoxyphenol hydroxylase-like FAD-dependent oxidoreductase
MSEMPQALIIGGSLGGLFAANLLHAIGWRVDIYERVPEELAGRGAGIATHPELFQALQRCDIAIDDSIGVRVAQRITLGQNGERIGELAMPQTFTSWGRLYALLRGRFPHAAYHQGFSVDRVEQDARAVSAIFANGHKATGDLLIAADGFRSTVRAQVHPEAKPQYAGYIAWRGMVEERTVSPRTHAALFDSFCFGLPPREQFIGYPVPGAENSTREGERRYNFVWYRPAGEDDTLADMLTDATGRVHEMSIPPPLIRAQIVAQMRRDTETLLAPQFAEVVRLVEQPFFQPIYDMESARLAHGRVALLGDAAFVARPHAGLGVTKAAGDAMVLADALRESPDDVDAALARYQIARLEYGRTVVARGRHLGAYMQAQIKTEREREMAERYRTPEAIMRETAIPPPFND